MIFKSTLVDMAIVMGVAVIAFVVATYAEDDQIAQAKSRATQLTGKAMGSVKNAANKGAERIAKSADGITVRVERFVNPQQPQSGQSNLLVSAGRGVARLLRNYTVEAGRALSTVGGGAVNFVKNTSKATAEVAKASVSSRLSKPALREQAATDER